MNLDDLSVSVSLSHLFPGSGGNSIYFIPFTAGGESLHTVVLYVTKSSIDPSIATDSTVILSVAMDPAMDPCYFVLTCLLPNG